MDTFSVCWKNEWWRIVSTITSNVMMTGYDFFEIGANVYFYTFFYIFTAMECTYCNFSLFPKIINNWSSKNGMLTANHVLVGRLDFSGLADDDLQSFVFSRSKFILVISRRAISYLDTSWNQIISFMFTHCISYHKIINFNWIIIKKNLTIYANGYQMNSKIMK